MILGQNRRVTVNDVDIRPPAETKDLTVSLSGIYVVSYRLSNDGVGGRKIGELRMLVGARGHQSISDIGALMAYCHIQVKSIL